MGPYTVNNIKVSYKLEEEEELKDLTLKEFAESHTAVTKITGNFFVLRDEFVYVIFYTGHVNCTKLKNLQDIELSRKFLRLTFPRYNVSEGRVDNIVASGRVNDGERINLFIFSQFLNRCSIPHHFNPQHFPGLNVKFGDVTFVVFTSGKYIAVGSKSHDKLRFDYERFHDRVDCFRKWSVRESKQKCSTEGRLASGTHTG